MANITDAMVQETADAIQISDKLIPLNVHGLEGALLHTMTAVWLELRKLRTGSGFGSQFTQFRPVNLNGVDAVNILEKDPENRVRHVRIGVDSAVGGQFPTIRVGTGAVSTSGGGILLNPGEIHDLGEIGGDVALQGVSSAAITLFVIVSG